MNNNRRKAARDLNILGWNWILLAIFLPFALSMCAENSKTEQETVTSTKATPISPTRSIRETNNYRDFGNRDVETFSPANDFRYFKDELTDLCFVGQKEYITGLGGHPQWAFLTHVPCNKAVLEEIRRSSPPNAGITTVPHY